MRLEVRGLSKSFGGVKAVRNVSFAIRQGEALGLVGESGSGKSTLAKLVSRLSDPDGGNIFVDNVDVTRTPQRALGSFRRKVQILFQNPYASFDPRLTIEESLSEPFLIAGSSDAPYIRRMARELLRMVSLPEELALRYPHQISGGECQRIAIARALSRDPELFICDEPVSSLDLLAQARVLNLLLSLQKNRRVSLLFISHDLRVIRHLCDWVLVMKDGAICEEGPLLQVFQDPQHPYTQELVAAAGLGPRA